MRWLLLHGLLLTLWFAAPLLAQELNPPPETEICQPAVPEVTETPAPIADPAPVAPSLPNHQGVTLAVVGAVERPWLPSSRVFAPGSGQEYLALRVRLENQSAEPRRFNALNFEVQTEDAARWSPRLGRRAPDLSAGDLPPGGAVEGWLVFEVPIGLAVTELQWTPALQETYRLPLGSPPR